MQLLDRFIKDKIADTEKEIQQLICGYVSFNTQESLESFISNVENIDQIKRVICNYVKQKYGGNPEDGNYMKVDVQYNHTLKTLKIIPMNLYAGMLMLGTYISVKDAEQIIKDNEFVDGMGNIFRYVENEGVKIEMSIKNNFIELGITELI